MFGRPLTVVFDLTERCNLKCVMCYFSEIDRLKFAPYDKELSADGNLPIPVFEKIAAELFPSAWRVALGCAAEPMIHPKFVDILEIAGRYKVQDLWFPTNLLALTETKAEALVRHGVTTVAASIDGVRQETYEKIRIGGKFSRLLQRLELFNEVKKRHGSQRPSLRIIFTWMKSNRHDLVDLPAFAAEHGASEIDVRFVTPTTGVDVTPELLSDEDPAELRRDLKRTAEDAVSRGIRLASYPEFESEEERPTDLVGRVRRRAWHLKAGLDRFEYRHHRMQERLHGCAHPGRTYVIRPNGAVYPCIFWEGDPIGFFPDDDLAALAEGKPLTAIRDGLHCGQPIGTCATCSQRRDAF